jgi:multidrug efflux pump subunit AcrB
MNDKSHNLAYRLSEMFVTSKLTILTILAVSIFGIIAIFLTPREENPQIVIPSAQITVQLPGASALEVEELIVTPLEGIVGEILGVDHTYGTAMNSVGVVTVQFKAGENREDALVKLYNRVLSNLHRMPENAVEPLIKSLDVDDIAIVAITLASKAYDDYALKRIADRMGERLHSLKSVSVVKVKGGRDREIRIDLDPQRLQAFSIPLARVQTMLTASNIALPVGDTVRKGNVQTVYLQGFFQRVEDVRNLIIGQHENRPIYLGDIATISDGPPLERDRLSRFTFGAADKRFAILGAQNMSAVALTVAKKKGTNAVFMANDVLERIERMKSEFVPQNVHVIVTRNDGQKADDAVNVLIEHLGIAISTVFLVLVFFLGWKEALIVTMAVPLVFFMTMGADLLGGITINKVSLFALILSLGLLVDDAIVVIENIHRHYFKRGGRADKRDTDKRRMTILACAEVGGAANLATATVMAVFASLFLVSDMPGQYFNPIAFNVPIAMAASLFFAYTVTPWAAYRWLHLPSAAETNHKKQSIGRLGRFYRGFVLLAIRKKSLRWMLYGLTLALLAITILQPAWQFVRPAGVAGPQPFFGVALGFMPKDNKNTFSVAIEMPEYTPVETTDAIAREINTVLVNHPRVVNTLSWIGQTGVIDFPAFLRGNGDQTGAHIAQIRVNLIDKHKRDITSMDIVRKLRPRLIKIKARYPGSIVQLVEDPPGPASRATILAEIYGKAPAMLRKLSKKVTQAFHNTYDMVDINDTQPHDVQQNRIIVDKEKAALSGVSNSQVAQILSVLFQGRVMGRIHPKGEKNTVPIRVRVPHKYRLDPTQLDRVFVENENGKRIPLSELVRVVPVNQDRPILHKDNERVTFVGGELTKTAPVYAIIDLDRRLDGMDLGKGLTLETRNLTLQRVVPDTIGNYQLLWDGEIRLTLDTFRDMGFALGMAMMLVFLLLVAYYRSFSIPVVAMSSIPLGMIGVFPGHWIMGADFSATSMVGIIALAGVAIRSALLIIDFVRDNRANGMPLHEAAHKAGSARALPILLTTLAVILGSAIMLTDPVFGGLAISLIFGTAVSSALSIIIIPVLYYRVEKWRESKVPL